MIHLQACRPYLLALGLCAMSPFGHAALAQVAVRAFGMDLPSGVGFTVNTAGTPSGPALASRSVAAVAGDSSSYAQATADPLSGVVREKLGATVAASRYVVGRHAGGSSTASMSGSINLVGPASPGLATFTAVLEGSYNILTPAPFDYPSVDNSVAMNYHFQVGDSPEFHNLGDVYYFCCTPGTFSIPFSWTQLVSAGDSIFFDFYLDVDVLTVAGLSQFDASNTFKVTGVDLPDGYSFTSDASGFLSQFGAPVSAVPEPMSLLLVGLGLTAIGTSRRRIRVQQGSVSTDKLSRKTLNEVNADLEPTPPGAP